MFDMNHSQSIARSVVVIGGSYSGLHAAEVLSKNLPPNWTLTLVERNTHFNHVYSFPRFGVTGNSQRAFIPYTGVSKSFEDNRSDPRILQSSLSQQSSPTTAEDEMVLSSCCSSSSQTSHRIINASVTKISKGKIYLDRMVESYQPVPSDSRSAEVQRDGYESDSGYGSVTGSKSANSINRLFNGSGPTDTQTELSNAIPWDFLVYALGSQLPPPLQLPTDQPRTKVNGIQYLETQKEKIEAAQRIVVVGGGALGIQYATDIAHRYKLKNKPKSITLIHSRARLLPQFQPEVHEKAKAAIEELDVELVLGERVDLNSLKKDLDQQQPGEIVSVKSLSDPQKTWEADLVLLCTGQIPNTRLMAEFCPLAVPGGASSWNGPIKVKRTLQVSPSELGPSPVRSSNGRGLTCDCGSMVSEALEPGPSSPFWGRVFAVGDCIDGFGAIKAGHTGWNQADVAAKNIVKIAKFIEGGGEISDFSGVNFEEYHPGPPLIKLTLGLNRMVTQLPHKERPGEVEVEEVVKPIEKEKELGQVDGSDKGWHIWWKSKGIPVDEIGDGWN